MFRAITDWAAWLDQWLEINLGRPYNTVLSIGLVLEMISKIQTLPSTITHGRGQFGILFSLLVEAALLINQLGEFSHRRHKRRTQKAAAAAGVPIEHPPLKRPEPLRLEESRLFQLAQLVRRRFRR
ncbi:MAG TPA: hypothetical protein VIE16_08275 [Phenylobacterium sp.]|jgi:hypothetical protein